MANHPSNDDIADVLSRIAELLEAQRANPFRVRAYRNGANSVRDADRPVAALAREGGQEALTQLPNIGEGLAGVISSYVDRGRSDVLARLEGEVSPEDQIMQAPGIGEELAARIVRELDVETLEELEQAAHDGRLQRVEGIGPKRAETVRVGLAGLLSGAAQRRIRRSSGGEKSEVPQPGVELLLDVDEEYRQKAEAGELRKLAPKRFNPEGEAWLPILHTERDDWRFTALYSNTARAHDLNKTHDWVVIYYEKEGEEDQATVVTATHGPLEGERVVRGREDECRRYYDQAD